MHSLRQRQRGLSLVEMMVGVAVGLFIIAAAVTLVTMQLGDNRRILLETQVQQDLRAAADIIARDLRRAGYWSRAETGVWNASVPAAANSYLDITRPSNSEIGYAYRRAAGSDGPFGFLLTEGVIKTRLGGTSGWQELTDKNVLVVDDLEIVSDDSAITRLPCAKSCPLPIPVGGDANYCWPQIGVRSVVVTITGHAVSDASVQRTVSSRVRLRNENLRLRAGDPADPDACPT